MVAGAPPGHWTAIMLTANTIANRSEAFFIISFLLLNGCDSDADYHRRADQAPVANQVSSSSLPGESRIRLEQ